MRKTILILTIIILLSGCNPFSKKEEPTPTPPAETPTPMVIELPTPTPLPVAPPPGEDTVSLLDTAAPPLTEEPLPTVAPQAVQMPRFSAGGGVFSFVPPAGWVVDEPAEGVHIIHRAGDDLFTGSANTAPYIYLKVTPGVGTGSADLQTALDGLLLANLAGAQVTEPPLGMVIDGVTGVWQFVEGRTDGGPYRAFLLVIPAGESTLEAVVWSVTNDWPVYAPEMAKALETMRFPKG